LRGERGTRGGRRIAALAVGEALKGKQLCGDIVATMLLFSSLCGILSSREGPTMKNIVTSAKTDVFRLRVNPEVRRELEAVYAKNGLTLTDAINVFFQQSLNAGGFPFQVTEDNAEIIKAKALSRLVKELKAGDDCAELYTEEEALRILGADK